MKPFRSTLFLLLAVAGLALFFWLTRDAKGTGEQERAKGKIFDFHGDDVTSLKLKGTDVAVSLEKKDGTWRIVEPVSSEAEREAVLSILGELEFLQPRRTITANQIPDGEKSLAEWGLAPGNGRVDFAGSSNGRAFSGTLLIGRKAAIDGLCYAKGTGPDAYLIATASRDALFKKLDDIRSHAVIHAPAAEVDQCGLRQKTPPQSDAPSEFQISRAKGAGEAAEWRVEKPLSAPASPARVTAWLGLLDALRVKQFISDDAADLSAYGLTAPAAQIWIRRQAPPSKAAPAKDEKNAPKPEPDTLLIGIPVPGVPGEVYAKRTGESGVFTLPAESVAKLLADLPAARDRKVLSFRAADAVAFRAELPKPSAPGALSIVEVKRQGETGWVFSEATTGGAAGKEADAAQVEGFLKGLSVMEAPLIIRDAASDLRPYGLANGDRALIRLVVTVKKGESTEDLVLSLGKIEKPLPPLPQTPVLYAVNSAQPFVYGLDIAFLTRFPREAWRWRSPLVLGSDLKEEAITSVTRVVPGRPPETVKRAGAVFLSDRDGGDGTLQQEKVKEFWSKLAHLATVHWIGAPIPAYGLGLAPDAVRITLSLGEGEKKVLILGAPVAAVPVGGRAAQIEGESDVFLISEADYALLSGSFATVPTPSSKE
ncbi:protein of unknown function [Verrucomicrobium sp. GAS474]|uniref:DUF4340 domain-containing protein n=1 Tax=Verrucomicrobium sp. GAS474 TaxID=1882831 RepID=UPI00087DDA7A|nr:DUF4340 domain-containing protein [Verrucomicrobium sp. GAS474]SDU07740.1 protein of unknown function [Verrucomicrobium sp. GAS474]